MTFLLILLLSTLSVAGLAFGRTRSISWRRSARHGLGIAFVAAGISHLVDPVPFEQHLPGWVPAARAIILASGLAEIVLGVALVAARRRAPATGLAAVGLLLGVFPANVYVAVADVDVDGLPGGIYPWVRLPLQGLFIAWAWWCTRPTGEIVAGDGEVERFGLMPPVPTTSGPDRAQDGTRTTVQASVLRLRRFRDVPAFMAAALRLQSAFAESTGAIEMSLRAAPLRRTFWTLSHWRSDADLRTFVGHPAHRELMHRFGPAMRSSDFITWDSTSDVSPTWDDAGRRIAAAHRIPGDHPMRAGT